MTNIKDIIGFVLTVAAIILVLDALALAAWALSGQHPADGFYAGAITANIISAF